MQVCKLIWMEDLGAIAPYSFLHVIKLQFTGHKSLHQFWTDKSFFPTHSFQIFDSRKFLEKFYNLPFTCFRYPSPALLSEVVQFVVKCQLSICMHMNLTHLIFLGQLALFKRKFECGKYRDSISSKLSEEFNGISTDYCHRICVETRLISPQLAQVFQLFCLS